MPYLRQEEASERYVDEDTFVHSFAKNSADKAVPIETVSCLKEPVDTSTEDKGYCDGAHALLRTHGD